jgi:zinc transporter ZupT
MKNVVTSRGKFSSFLQLRNSMIEREKGKLDSAAPIQKQDKALLRASLLLKKTLTKSFREPENEDLQFMVNPKNVHVDNINSISPQNPEEFKPKSVLTPFLLLVALSMHGFFEGLALGIQGTAKDSIFLFIAIISHKWAEAFTLVCIQFNF